MPAFITPRLLFGAMFAAAVGLLGTAFYMEHQMMLEPCALCMMQRIWVGIVGVIALAAAIHGGAPLRWSMGVAGASVIGSGFSLRQLWLQNLPPEEVPACGPGLEYMIEVFPLSEVLRAMVLGTGNCAEVAWTLLGISIPGWVFISFLGYLVGCAWVYAVHARAGTAHSV